MTLHNSRSLVEFQLTCRALAVACPNRSYATDWGWINEVAPRERKTDEDCVANIIFINKRRGGRHFILYALKLDDTSTVDS